MGLDAQYRDLVGAPHYGFPTTGFLAKFFSQTGLGECDTIFICEKGFKRKPFFPTLSA
jgi:hypothetical protein